MTPHWTAVEIQRLMEARGMTRSELAHAAGLSLDQITLFFAGRCLLTITNIERLAKALNYEMELLSDGTPEPELVSCLYCGRRVVPVSVHGHTQCPKCQAILERCCED